MPALLFVCVGFLWLVGFVVVSLVVVVGRASLGARAALVGVLSASSLLWFVRGRAELGGAHKCGALLRMMSCVCVLYAFCVLAMFVSTVVCGC